MRQRSAFFLSGAALAVATLIGAPAPAEAAPIACTAAVTGKVTPSSGCQMGSTNNDQLNPPQVNIDGLFGFNDWIFGQKKLEEAETAVDLGFQVSGGLLGGTWSINNVWDTLGVTHLMIVLKGASPISYAAYLIEAGATAGTYASPFANFKGNLQDISHISIYYRTGRTVAEPHLLVLFGLGLFFLSRRLSASRHS